jgi:hypothetical protein
MKRQRPMEKSNANTLEAMSAMPNVWFRGEVQKNLGHHSVGFHSLTESGFFV